MTSEIRTNSLKSRAGLSTVTMTDTGPIISGVTTANNFKTGSSNLHSTGLTVGNTLVHSTGVNVGTGATVHSPTSNVLTLGTNNNERVRITSEGQVKLTGTNSGNHMSSFGTNVGGLTIDDVGNQHTGLEVSHGSNKVFLVASSNNSVYLSSYGTGNFILEHTGGGGTRERLRIDSSGRLLIGTTTVGDSTADNLTIADSGTCGITIRSGTSGEGNIFFSDGTSGAATYAGTIQYKHADDALVFHVAVSERLRIDSAGRVMIGTTTEGNGNADEFTISYINHAGVSGGDQGRCGMTIRSGDNTSGVTQNGYIYFSDGTSGANESMGVVAYEHSTDSMYLSTAQVARLRIDSSGRLLIGTTSRGQDDADNLTIDGSGEGTGRTGITIRSATNTFGSLFFSDATSGAGQYDGVVAYDHSTQTMRFSTASTQRVYISSGGDIYTAQNGTAFSWPSNPGHIIYTNGEYRSTSANGTHIRCNRMNGDGHVAQWYRGQTNMVGYISITSSGTGYGSGSSDERTKKNIEAWDENILDKFKSLTPKKFNFNWEDDSVSKHKGYIAQNELDKFPEAYPKNNLTDCDNEYHMFVPTDMTVYLMKGLKEAAEKIEQLEQENIALRIRVTNLEDN